MTLARASRPPNSCTSGKNRRLSTTAKIEAMTKPGADEAQPPEQPIDLDDAGEVIRTNEITATVLIGDTSVPIEIPVFDDSNVSDGGVDSSMADSSMDDFDGENNERLKDLINSYFAPSDPMRKLYSIPSVEGEIPADVLEEAEIKRARRAETARLRYHRLAPEKKKAVNRKRTETLRQKRQMARELNSMEMSVDGMYIKNEPVEAEEVQDFSPEPRASMASLTDEQKRARWAENSRLRYYKMTPEERRAYNQRRAGRRTGKGVKKEKEANDLLLELMDAEDVKKNKVKATNAQKAAAARARYHQKSAEEKRLLNLKRTEAFRRKRMEEELTLALQGSPEAMSEEKRARIKKIKEAKARRSERSRKRYHNMSVEERRAYNTKRYNRLRADQAADMALSSIDLEFLRNHAAEQGLSEAYLEDKKPAKAKPSPKKPTPSASSSRENETHLRRSARLR